MMFLIDEWIGTENIASLNGYEHVDRELIEFVLNEAGKFCRKELLPINREGDEHCSTFIDGQVKAPPGFKEAYNKYIENGWTGIDADPEYGGQGLPVTSSLLKPLGLSDAEKGDLLAFLETLSGEEIIVDAPEIPAYEVMNQ